MSLRWCASFRLRSLLARRDDDERRMSKPNSSVGRLSKFEMSGRGWVRAGWEPAFEGGSCRTNTWCIWGNVAVGQEADGLRGRR